MRPPARHYSRLQTFKFGRDIWSIKCSISGNMFQKGCNQCTNFLDRASQALSAQMDAITALEVLVATDGSSEESIAAAEERASLSALTWRQAVERLKIHELA